jgi:hypothetical protein
MATEEQGDRFMRVPLRILAAALVLGIGTGTASAMDRGPQTELWPIYPPYPYRAGHYPKLDWYDDMPPYTAISPSFYRKRFFMMSQERNRYRYQPHIFRGNADAYGDYGGPIEDVDIQGVGASLRRTYEDTYRD